MQWSDPAYRKLQVRIPRGREEDPYDDTTIRSHVSAQGKHRSNLCVDINFLRYQEFRDEFRTGVVSSLHTCVKGRRHGGTVVRVSIVYYVRGLIVKSDIIRTRLATYNHEMTG